MDRTGQARGGRPSGVRRARRSSGVPAQAAEPLVRLDRRRPEPVEAPTLDAQQQAVVDHRDGHLLVLAGPGTGKTTTLVELVVGRLAPGPGQLDPGSVLALTFGRRAARELSDRVARRLAGGTVPVVSTFHSFAYGVLRQHSDPAAFASPPRLMTAAEQEARLREVLTGSVGDGRLAWPESLAGAVGTRGIAEQVRALLARARGQGLDGRALATYGRRHGIPVWTALGAFFEEYLDTMGFEGTLDYAELIHQAVALASKERDGRALRETYKLIVVDEYQDTDPAQVRLLRELARGGAQVVAVGDPDQAIYEFRGADAGGILEFADRFRDPATGAPARIQVLRTTRRFPARIAEAAQRVLGAAPLPGLPVDVQRRHRSPIAAAGPARVETRTYPSVAAEAAGVAETLLRAHSGRDGEEPRPWSDMAVLVRNPAVSAPALVRAMRAAGIPVAVPPDEVALADEPAAKVLLAVVALALDPDSAPADTGRLLLGGPLGRVDPVAIRGLARAALLAHRAAVPAHRADVPSRRADDSADRADVLSVSGDPAGTGDASDQGAVVSVGDHGPAAGVGDRGAAGHPADPDGADPDGGDPRGTLPGRVSAEALLTRALGRGELPVGSPEAARAGFRRVARAISAVRDSVGRGEMVAESLWAGWTATDWPERLRRAALQPGAAGAGGAGADRDLDALVSLFDIANRLPAQRRGRAGLQGFLADVGDLRLPTESWSQAETGRDHVRVLSAHRAKGLEWGLVVVAAVQEGQWPDVRLRSDLLHVEELGRRGRLERRTHADLLAEERRLMYVACTRARQTLVVTAVDEPVEGGMQSSRFLADLEVPERRAPERPRVPLAGPALLTALRQAATAPVVVRADGPDPTVEALRAAAVDRLAGLAAIAEGQPLNGLTGPLTAAVPERWWGARAVTLPGVEALSSAADARTPGVDAPSSEADARSPGVDAPSSRAGRAVDGSVGDSGLDLAPAGQPGEAITLSPSSVEALRRCPLAWFLDRRVGAGAPAGPSAAIGTVVHAVAEAIARGEVDPDRSAIDPFVDAIWSAMPFEARYHSEQERARVDEMVDSLLLWLRASERSAAGAEIPFTVELDSPDGPVVVRGKVDRVDVDGEGRFHLVDFKTGRSAQSKAAAAENPQLGVYQLAAREGALAVTTPEAVDPAGGAESLPLGGAELVNLGARLSSGMPTLRFQAPLPEGRTWVHDVVDDASRLARGPRYPARRNDRCGQCVFQLMCPAHRSEAIAGRAWAPGAGPAPGPASVSGEGPAPGPAPGQGAAAVPGGGPR